MIERFDRIGLAGKSEETSAAAEASAILALTRDACQHLNISWVPDRVMWAESYFSGQYISTVARYPTSFRDVPSDHPVMFRDALYVAPSMMGRLQPEEWRPIVASSMIYHAKLATRKAIGIIVRLAPFCCTSRSKSLCSGPQGARFLGFHAIVCDRAFGCDIFGVLFLIAPYQRKLWLKSDQIASEYVGYPIMIGVLDRVQGFRISELEGGRFNNLPSLAERIAILRESSNA